MSKKKGGMIRRLGEQITNDLKDLQTESGTAGVRDYLHEVMRCVEAAVMSFDAEASRQIKVTERGKGNPGYSDQRRAMTLALYKALLERDAVDEDHIIIHTNGTGQLEITSFDGGTPHTVNACL